VSLTRVLFDLDGTLIDSLADLTDAVNHMLAGFGRPPLAEATVRTLVGRGARNLVQRALGTSETGEVERGLGLFTAYNTAHIADKSRLYPGVVETLSTLSSHGYTCAVVSNKNADLSRLILITLGIESFFAAVYGGDSCPEMKPSPLPLLSVLSELGADVGEAVMVGDSINDILAGKRAGITTIGCNWGYGGPDELAEADYLATSMQQVSDIIRSNIA